MKISDKKVSVKCLILNRVLIGDSCIGNIDMKKPCIKADLTMNDSMCDNIRDPSIVVMSSGSDCQVYPEFVLYFLLNT